MSDLIERQAIIDWLKYKWNRSADSLFYGIQKLSPAQPDNQINLCNSCNYSYPDCPSKNDDVIFGNGIGNDNICACNKYKPHAQPEPTRIISEMRAIPSDDDHVSLSETVMATYYDEENEEWSQKSVTVRDVLDSVCDEYTVLPSAQLDLSEYSDKLWRSAYERGKRDALEEGKNKQFEKLTVRNSNGKPYYSIIYLEFDENGVGHNFEGYSSYDLDTISDYLKMYFNIGQPKQENGKWIGIGDIPETCSFCGEDWSKYIIGDKWYTGEMPNFCPNCGAKMEKEGKAND